MKILERGGEIHLNNSVWYVIDVEYCMYEPITVYQLNNPFEGTIFITHRKLEHCFDNFEFTYSVCIGDTVTKNNKSYEIIHKIYDYPDNIVYVENLGWYEEKSIVDHKITNNTKTINWFSLKPFKQIPVSMSDYDIDNKANEEMILIKECLNTSELSDFVNNKIQLEKDGKLKNNLITWSNDGKNWQINTIEDFSLLMCQKYKTNK